jgi:LacI family transcriptional regulator
MLSGPVEVSTAVDRVVGFQRAYTQRGLESPGDLIFYDSYTVSGGVRMAQLALAVQPRPTALFASNNFIAIGAFQTLRVQGLQVPGDLSLVAFDDLPTSFMLDPFLTVATQPAYDMGRRATALLLARLSEEKQSAPQEIVLPTPLILRRSTAPPPRNGRKSVALTE